MNVSVLPPPGLLGYADVMCDGRVLLKARAVKAKRRLFLAAIREGTSVKDAAEYAGLTIGAWLALYRTDPEVAQAMDALNELSLLKHEDLLESIVDGTHVGKIENTRALLMMFRMKKLNKEYSDGQTINVDARTLNVSNSDFVEQLAQARRTEGLSGIVASVRAQLIAARH